MNRPVDQPNDDDVVVAVFPADEVLPAGAEVVYTLLDGRKLVKARLGAVIATLEHMSVDPAPEVKLHRDGDGTSPEEEL